METKKPNTKILKALHEQILLGTLNFVNAGKKYGVSDNAVRKWFKAAGFEKIVLEKPSGKFECTYCGKELETYKKERVGSDFAISVTYGLQAFHQEKEKRRIQVMFHKKKRINKKWSKSKNDMFFIIKTRPRMPLCAMAAVA